MLILPPSIQKDAWFKPSQENISAGVCLRVSRGKFRTFPYENPYLAPFEAAVKLLNPLVAVKIRSAAVHSALATVPEDSAALYIDPNTRVQILDTVTDLPKADKEQCCAFLRDERVLVVWCDELEQVVPLCKDFESKIMKLVWTSRPPTMASASFMNSSSSAFGSRRGSMIGSPRGSNLNLVGGGPGGSVASTGTTGVIPESALPRAEGSSANANANANADGAEKEKEAEEDKNKEKKERKSNWWRLGSRKQPEGVVVSKEKDGESDVEKGVQPRRAMLFAPLYGGLALGLSVFFGASGLSILLQEFRLDPDYVRFALLVLSPLLLCVSIFFAYQVIINISFVIGPVAQYHENSKFYSAIKPEPNPDVDSALPHITLEMPVYKESLEETM
ncbi:hypothetical protein AX16_009700 [Volvariella volvacea WC 439]|nr:hypothetical protein AX16_009700 [Volvariella volvacea WC 439]